MRRTLALGLLAGTLAVATSLLWFGDVVGWDRTFPTDPTTVVVPRGATGHDVAVSLEKDHVITSALAFEVLARIRGERNAIEAGEYAIDAHESASQILGQLVSGTGQTARWVTIPEGFTTTEIARTFAKRGIGTNGDLARTLRRGSLRFGRVATPSLEGYLFPDTYLVPAHATADDVATMMTRRFLAALPRGAAADAARLGLTIPQVVTVASLVEREAKSDTERPVMAGVYYNRLARGMPLQVDATLEYGLSAHEAVLTSRDVARESPYNTYRHVGLPPTPIANPGLPSLLAALHPQPSAYLYYVYKGNGHHAFARTLAEHNANVARYLR